MVGVGQMIKTIKTCVALLETTEQSKNLNIQHLRGFIGYLFLEDAEFHHHNVNSYHYPLVQYKKIDEKPAILGLQDYAEILMKKISIVDSITTPNSTIKITATNLKFSTTELKEAKTLFEFTTPWIALNEENYKLYKKFNAVEKKKLLEKILIGNVLSALKGLGILVDYKITAEIIDYKPVSVNAHDNFFQGFKAHFILNINLPELIGLGKSVSKGFGTIRRLT